LIPFKRESGDLLPYDYPYYWADKEELLAHLIDVYDHYDQAVESIEPFCKQIANHCSLEGNIDQLVFEIENMVDQQDRRIRDQIVPAMSLLQGRIDEVRHQSAKRPVQFRAYTEWLLQTHRVYSPLRYELNPFYLNPSLWVVYKVLRAHLSSNLLRDDPLFYSKGEE